MLDHQTYMVEGVAFAMLSALLVIWLVSRRLGRSHPGLNLWRILLVAYVLRVVAAGALDLTAYGGTALRGGDETGFLANAHFIGTLAFGSRIWLYLLSGHVHTLIDGQPLAISGTLHVFVMSLENKLFNASAYAMRSTMAGFAVAGIGLLSAAVYELAGRRAARLTAWLLAVEPANVFFSTALHKEPLIYLAAGLVAYGGARIWRRPSAGALGLMVVGCLIATATRPYAGWFLGAGTAALVAHAAIRSAASSRALAIGLLTVVASAAVIAAPAIGNATSSAELRTQIQVSQNANATDNSNLKLPPVDFSSRSSIAENLPIRMFDVMFRPFPWQLGDASQQFGLLETLCVFAALALLLRMTLSPRSWLSRAGPLFYPGFALLVAYSLASGNAGTSFRYRTTIVEFLIAVVVVLRSNSLETVAVVESAPAVEVLRVAPA